jgi:hypothetical protein
MKSSWPTRCPWIVRCVSDIYYIIAPSPSRPSMKPYHFRKILTVLHMVPIITLASLHFLISFRIFVSTGNCRRLSSGKWHRVVWQMEQIVPNFSEDTAPFLPLCMRRPEDWGSKFLRNLFMNLICVWPCIPCVYKRMLRWFPSFQVATTCLSSSPPDFNFLVTFFSFHICVHVK